MSQQGLRQASARSVTGTTLNYEGDFSALFAAYGLTTGSFNGRLLAWINISLGTSYTNLNSAMQAFAEANDAVNWSSMGTFYPNPLYAYGVPAFLFDVPLSQYKNGSSFSTSFSSLTGLTFTRAGAKWGQSLTSGLWLPFASGVPAIVPDRGISIEGARASIAARSRRLDDASAWTLTNITTSTVQGVDGVSGSATRLTASGANGTAIGISTTSGSAARRLAPFIRRVAGTGNIDISLDGGSTWTTQTITSSFARVTGLSQTLANPRVAVRIVSSGDSVDGDFANGETGAFDSSPIESAAANVTRPADVCSIAVSGISYPCTLFAEFERVVDTGVAETLIHMDAGSATDRMVLRVSATDLAQLDVQSGGATQASTTVAGALALNTTYRTAARCATNDAQIARGGTLGTQDTSVTAPATPTTIRLGGDTGATLYSFGFIRRAAAYSDNAFNNANLQAIST